MRLELTRSGGIAGLQKRRSLDTEALSSDDASELERLVSELDLEDLERRSPIRGRGADRFQYDLHVKRQGGEHRVVVSEDEVPASLKAVLDQVLRRGHEDR